jgi:hypothetical protein
MKAKLFMLVTFSVLAGVLSVMAQTSDKPQLAKSSVSKGGEVNSADVNTGKAKPELKRMAVEHTSAGSTGNKPKPDSQPKMARSESKTEEPVAK